MEIVGNDVLKSFIERHADARQPLGRWEQTVRAAHWRNFAELRCVFAGADQVKLDRLLVATVFNIGGNKYRLISEVSYANEVVQVLLILTHAEYSRDRWKARLKP